MARFTTTSKPNFKRIAKRWPKVKKEALRKAADVTTVDYETLYRESKDIDLKAQKPNQPGTQARKSKTYGWITPLVADRILSQSAHWRITQPNDSSVEIRPPAARMPALPRLLSLGYRPPGVWGQAVSSRAEPIIRQIFAQAVQQQLGIGGALRGLAARARGLIDRLTGGGRGRR